MSMSGESENISEHQEDFSARPAPRARELSWLDWTALIGLAALHCVVMLFRWGEEPG